MHIDDLLREVVENQGSDLHLTGGIKPTMRVWGKLAPMEQYDVLTPEDTFQLGYSMLNTFQKQKFEKFWELDLSYGVPGLGRFRVNIYRQRGAVGIAARVIPMTIPSIEALNLPPALKDLTRKARGLALGAVRREDPNVVLVGEMRDLETIGAALTIAETGHLVFATLHTANAAQSVDRIIDVFPPYQQQQGRMQLSMVLEAVISQQLLPKPPSPA